MNAKKEKLILIIHKYDTSIFKQPKCAQNTYEKDHSSLVYLEFLNTKYRHMRVIDAKGENLLTYANMSVVFTCHTQNFKFQVEI